MAVIGAFVVVVLAAFSILAYTRTNGFVHEESVQRVHTIGERCETTRHQLTLLEGYLPPTNPQVEWFKASYGRCHKSLAKVEKRAGVKYKP